MLDSDLRSPLNWPAGKPRTLPHQRKRAAFGTKNGARWGVQSLTLYQARQRLDHELALLKVRAHVLSSNLILNKDGSPRSGQGEPADCGVAVYFELDGKPIALACDRWDRAADNVVAIAKHIEALRGQDRWGVGSIEQAFAGYAALPAPGQHARRPWRAVLDLAGVGVALEGAEKRYRELAKIHHPSVGGDPQAWDELQTAIADARRELGA
jgi:hypothetical protein